MNWELFTGVATATPSRRYCSPSTHCTNSPLVLLFIITDAYYLSAAPNCKLVPHWTPLDTGSCPVQTEDDQSRLPLSPLSCPYVGIPIYPAGYYHVRFRSPVYAGDSLLVLLECGREFPVGSLLGVYLHFVVVGGDGYLCAVLVEGVTGDWSPCEVL